MGTGQELIKGWLGFKFAYHARKRGTVVVQFGFLHASLAICIAKEVQYDIERLFRIVDNVRKSLSLTICQKLVSRHACFGHPNSP
jgi:hypothetical protein